MDNLKLEKSDWYLLRDAVCGALHHKENKDCIWFKKLPKHLKEHEVGKLVFACLYENDKTALDKAAKLLTNGSEKSWLLLFKS